MTALSLDSYAACDTPEPPPPVIDRDLLSYDAWGRMLTANQYLDRERSLWRTPFAQQGLRTFVLRRGDEPLASCEAYRVPVAISHDQHRRRGIGFGIASVYVATALRGHGHASALLRLVHEQLQGEGALCTYLISEVNPTIYSRLGYQPLTVPLRSFAPEPHDPGPPLSPVEPPLRFLPLRSADPAQLDLPEVDGLLERRGRFCGPLAIPITAAQVHWHIARGHYYAQVLDLPRQRHAGAACGAAFALWSASPAQGVLRVLCLFPGEDLSQHPADALADQGAAFRAVLHAARHEAHQLGLRRVELWDNPRVAAVLRGGVPSTCEDVLMINPLATTIADRPARSDDWQDWERAHWL